MKICPLLSIGRKPELCRDDCAWAVKTEDGYKCAAWFTGLLYDVEQDKEVE